MLSIIALTILSYSIHSVTVVFVNYVLFLQNLSCKVLGTSPLIYTSIASTWCSHPSAYILLPIICSLHFADTLELQLLIILQHGFIVHGKCVEMIHLVFLYKHNGVGLIDPSSKHLKDNPITWLGYCPHLCNPPLQPFG